MTVFESWTDTIEAGKCLDTVYFDYKKAFDSVAHRRLLGKLDSNGIRVGTQIYNLIEDYLSDRVQRVVLNGVMSHSAPVVSGVPQGSVLGPLLFLIFVNDMPKAVLNHIRLFADDTKLYSEVNDVKDCELLQEDIEALESWANKWQLSFHPGKCKVLRVGSRHPEFQYLMHDGDNTVNLDFVNSETDLGVITDKGLTFTDHIDSKAKKANQIVALIRRSFHYLDCSMFTNLFKTLVRPILEYAHSAWFPSFIYDVKKLENVQRRATKMVPGLQNLEYGERLKKLKLPSLEYRRARGDMIEVFKILNGYYDVEFPWLVRDLDSVTRGNDFKLKKPNCKTTSKRRMFSFRVINDWNSLSNDIVNSPSLNWFKNRLDKFWLDKQYAYTD